MLTERCVELLAADAAGLMLADQRGTLQLMTSTLEQARMLELFELQIDEGPCLECFATGRPITNVDLSEAQDRWPVFTRAAVEAGFGSTSALPMRLRGQVSGALNLFTHGPSALTQEQIAVGQAMADVATIGLLHERNLHEQTALSEQLQTALTSRVLVEQAKGMLAARGSISVAERSSGCVLTRGACCLATGRLPILLPSARGQLSAGSCVRVVAPDPATHYPDEVPGRP